MQHEIFDDITESLPPLKYKSNGVVEYMTYCEVQSNIPVVPDDTLRSIPRKYGVALEVLLDDKWIRIGVITRWHNKNGEIELKCLRSGAYEIPIKVTIRNKRSENQTCISSFFGTKQ